ncbi:MAG: hypothetical protein NC078_02835 [Ruminococcus sp.]|nr:hypothetical protein [Ruminococcus sp.]
MAALVKFPVGGDVMADPFSIVVYGIGRYFPVILLTAAVIIVTVLLIKKNKKK